MSSSSSVQNNSIASSNLFVSSSVHSPSSSSLCIAGTWCSSMTTKSLWCSSMTTKAHSTFPLLFYTLAKKLTTIKVTLSGQPLIGRLLFKDIKRGSPCRYIVFLNQKGRGQPLTRHHPTRLDLYLDSLQLSILLVVIIPRKILMIPLVLMIQKNPNQYQGLLQNKRRQYQHYSI